MKSLTLLNVTRDADGSGVSEAEEFEIKSSTEVSQTTLRLGRLGRSEYNKGALVANDGDDKTVSKLRAGVGAVADAFTISLTFFFPLFVAGVGADDDEATASIGNSKSFGDNKIVSDFFSSSDSPLRPG